MNPGNGIETTSTERQPRWALRPFKLMNPGNGIETNEKAADPDAPAGFQINESRQRDWNATRLKWR